MAGILAQMPGAAAQLFRDADMQLAGLTPGRIGVETLIVLTVLVFGLIMRATHLRRMKGVEQLPVGIGESESVADNAWE